MFGNKNEKSKKSQPPSLNKFMHPRNPYKNLPSFKELAVLYPEFRTYCTFDFKGKAFIDFKNADTLRTLTTCLLHKDFGLKIQIPNDRLVPTLPLRMNYLLWIEDLLSLFFKNLSASGKQAIVGVDIGTGAACVYPLLGYKKFGWHFVATESDSTNFNSAKSNVKENELQDRIFVIQSSDLFDVVEEKDVSIFIQNKKAIHNPTQEAVSNHEEVNSLSQDCSESYTIDFTVCNPPFFSSEVELDSNHNSKKETRSQPHSVSTGSAQEKVTEGGEIFFITKLIEKSIQYKDRIRIFTTLIGIKNHLKIVVNLIKEKGKGFPVSISQTEFCQGRTMRWGVAWSFSSKISLDRVVSKKKQLTQKPFVLPIPRSMMTSYSVYTVWSLIQTWLKEIKIKPQVIKVNKYFMFAIVKAYKPTWLNQRQKRRQQKKKNADEENILSNESHSETEYSPHKRKPEEEVEGNLLKRLKLQMSEANLEEINESMDDKHTSESNNLSSGIQTNELNKSSCELQLNESSEETEINEQIECDDLDVSKSSEEISHIGDEISDEDDITYKKGMNSEELSFTVHCKTGNVSSSSGECELDGPSEICSKFPPVGNKQGVTNRFSPAESEGIPAWKHPGSSAPINEKGVKAGLECFLKCSMQLKHTEALITLELNFLTGIGKREAMYQLIQYINNRLRQNK